MQNISKIPANFSEQTGIANKQDILSQIQQIQNIVKSVMQENKHFGVIAGTKNKTLYKAGAELLLQTFRLAPDYEVIESVHEENYIRYVVKCTIYSISTEKKVSSGLGSCSTHETKYRYKWIPTSKKPNKEEAEKLKAEGKGRWRKINGNFVWHEKQDNNEIYDTDNTILKMAGKRALIEATEHAIPASDTFTEGFDFSINDEPPTDRKSPGVSKVKDFKDSSSTKNQTNMSDKVSYKMKLHKLLTDKHGITNENNMINFIFKKTGKKKLTEKEAKELYEDLFEFNEDNIPY